MSKNDQQNLSASHNEDEFHDAFDNLDAESEQIEQEFYDTLEGPYENFGQLQSRVLHDGEQEIYAISEKDLLLEYRGYRQQMQAYASENNASGFVIQLQLVTGNRKETLAKKEQQMRGTYGWLADEPSMENWPVSFPDYVRRRFGFASSVQIRLDGIEWQNEDLSMVVWGDDRVGVTEHKNCRWDECRMPDPQYFQNYDAVTRRDYVVSKNDPQQHRWWQRDMGDGTVHQVLCLRKSDLFRWRDQWRSNTTTPRPSLADFILQALEKTNGMPALPASVKGIPVVRLEAMDFENDDLREVDFSGMECVKLDLERCDLTDASFRGAYLQDVTFSEGCVLNGVDMRQAAVRQVTFHGDKNQYQAQGMMLSAHDLNLWINRGLIRFTQDGESRLSDTASRKVDLGNQAVICDPVASLAAAQWRPTGSDTVVEAVAKLAEVVVTVQDMREFAAQKNELSLMVFLQEKHHAKPTDFVRFRAEKGMLLSDCDLSWRDLRGVNFAGVVWSHVVLNNANLAGACFESATLKDVSCNGANLRYTQMVDVKADGLSAKGADASFAQWDFGNFGDAELDGVILAGASAFKSDFSGSNINQGQLGMLQAEGANFRQARMNELRARYAQLQGAILEEVKAVEADFTGARLTAVEATKIDLTGAVLEAVEAVEINLTEAQMGHTRAARADFYKAKLEKAEIAYADWKYARMNEVNAETARIKETQMQGIEAKLAVFRAAVMEKVSMEDADLRQAILQDAQVKESNLRHAWMREAEAERSRWTACQMDGIHAERTNFTKAVMKRCDLQRADWRGANLSGFYAERCDFTDGISDLFTEVSGLRTSECKGDEVLTQHQAAVSRWLNGESRYGIPKTEQDIADRRRMQQLGAAIVGGASGAGIGLAAGFSGALTMLSPTMLAVAGAAGGGAAGVTALNLLIHEEQGHLANGLGDCLAELGAMAVAGGYDGAVTGIPAGVIAGVLANYTLPGAALVTGGHAMGICVASGVAIAGSEAMAKAYGEMHAKENPKTPEAVYQEYKHKADKQFGGIARLLLKRSFYRDLVVGAAIGACYGAIAIALTASGGLGPVALGVIGSMLPIVSTSTVLGSLGFATRSLWGPAVMDNKLGLAVGALAMIATGGLGLAVAAHGMQALGLAALTCPLAAIAGVVVMSPVKAVFDAAAEIVKFAAIGAKFVGKQVLQVSLWAVGKVIDSTVDRWSSKLAEWRDTSPLLQQVASVLTESSKTITEYGRAFFARGQERADSLVKIVGDQVRSFQVKRKNPPEKDEPKLVNAEKILLEKEVGKEQEGLSQQK